MANQIEPLRVAEHETSLRGLINALPSADDSDTLAQWLRQLLDGNQGSVAALGLPKNQVSQAAVVTLVDAQDVLGHQVEGLLADRIRASLALLPSIERHGQASRIIKGVVNTSASLRKLMSRNSSSDPGRGVDLVAQAMRFEATQIFKDHPNQPTIWPILRTLQENPGKDRGEARCKLITKVAELLRDELEEPGGTDCSRRHIWWALEILVSEAGTGELADGALVDGWIRFLFDNLAYGLPRSRTPESIPDMSLDHNELLWETVNIARIAQHPASSQLACRPGIWEVLDKRAMWLNEVDVPQNIRAFSTILLAMYDLDQAVARYRPMNDAVLGSALAAPLCMGDLVLDRTTSRWLETASSTIGQLIREPERWTNPTLSSAILCAGPGQGKSILMEKWAKQIQAQFRSDGIEARIISRVAPSFATPRDVEEIAELAPNSGIICIDEVDKCRFDLFASLLDPLQRNGVHQVWLFAQSAFPTTAALQDEARLRASDNRTSLQDFLTRLGLGVLELPPLHFSPMHRAQIALSWARTSFPNVRQVRLGWIEYFLRNGALGDPRTIVAEASRISVVAQRGVLAISDSQARVEKPRLLGRCSERTNTVSIDPVDQPIEDILR